MTGERAFSRRVLLRSTAAAGAFGGLSLAGLSGCTSTASHRLRPRAVAPPATVAPDVALLTRSLADEERLLAYCAAAARRHPSLAAPLAPVRQVQREHVDVLRQALPRRHSAPDAPSPVLPQGRGAVKAGILAMVRRAQRRRLADCLAAQSGPLARLLASVSASHAVTLDRLGAGR